MKQMKKSLLKTVKLKSAKGYTLIEMILALFILIMFQTLSTGLMKADRLNSFILHKQTLDTLVHTQFLALKEHRNRTVEIDKRIESFSEIYFNGRGAANTAQTLKIYGLSKTYKITIQLGAGRFSE